MSGPNIRRLKQFVGRQLGLRRYLRRPGDGRRRPQIPAAVLLWSQIAAQVLREWSFHAVERLVCSRARRALAVGQSFGDDALAYFSERLDPQGTRQALGRILHRVKRNKAFNNSRFIGLALDGTGAGRSSAPGCSLCHPLLNATHQVCGYLHHFSMISVVGTGLSLPFDVEPYGPQDSEYAASQRLLERAVTTLGQRFADYVVGDGLYATAPFLRTARSLGLRVIARLKDNLPQLLLEAQRRFGAATPAMTFEVGADRVETWDADNFLPWEGLPWPAVRVLRYRQHKPDGKVIEAYWLTDFPLAQVGSRSLYFLAKSRWEIENQGFNEGKTRHGFEHIAHHHPNSLLIGWLLAILALTVERLYRLRYLHRGTHRPLSAISLVHLLRLSLGSPALRDTG